MSDPVTLAEWFRSTCGGIIMMYVGGPDSGKQTLLRDDPRYIQILAILADHERLKDEWDKRRVEYMNAIGTMRTEKMKAESELERLRQRDEKAKP